jgi:hypothetical protein
MYNIQNILDLLLACVDSCVMYMYTHIMNLSANKIG